MSNYYDGYNPMTGRKHFHTGEECNWSCPYHLNERQEENRVRFENAAASSRIRRDHATSGSYGHQTSSAFLGEPTTTQGSDDLGMWLGLLLFLSLILGTISHFVGYPGIWFADYVQKNGFFGNPTTGAEVAVVGALLLLCLVMTDGETSNDGKPKSEQRSSILRGCGAGVRLTYYMSGLFLVIIPIIGCSTNYFISKGWIVPWFWANLASLFVTLILVCMVITLNLNSPEKAPLRGRSFLVAIGIALVLAFSQSNYTMKYVEFKASPTNSPSKSQ